jgi:N,N'-diacetyllegionaminate synthase
MRIGRTDTDTGIALIAEIGNNHEGSVSLAREMIEAAHESGADAIKLQTLVPDEFVSPRFPDRLSQMQQFALTIDDTLELINSYRLKGVVVFSTPLDLMSADALAPHVPLFKVSSGDLTWPALLCLIGDTGKDVILSTGMAYMWEVKESVAILEGRWQRTHATPSLALLHCVSAYPAAPDSVNLAAILAMRRQFPRAAVGYSDHALGIDVAVTAVAAGARIIEKHFTLDKQQSDFRDHALSADPADFRELRLRVDDILERMGSGEKGPTTSEAQGRVAFRRSITVRRFLPKGHVLTDRDLVSQRPGDGMPPNMLNAVVGRVLKTDVDPGHLLQIDDLA